MQRVLYQMGVLNYFLPISGRPLRSKNRYSKMRRVLNRIIFKIVFKLAGIFGFWRYPVDRDPEEYSQKILNRPYRW